MALVKKGHTVGIDVRAGAVKLTINKHVLMLNRLEEELKAIAVRERGDLGRRPRSGLGYYQTDVTRQDFRTLEDPTGGRRQNMSRRYPND